MKENMKEMVGGCCVCSDERGWPDNPLVYCDGNGCTVAVHQACYGIIAVPTGPWFCRKCESPDHKGKARCELCPSKSGALKRTDVGGWAHVVCALYIPEVRFGNVTSMEPIVLRLIPQERYNKMCYICQESGKTHRANAGACMQCNKTGCKQQFHVTCAQSLGLLCEEAGNYLDNVKYCGYCQHHYSKLKKGGNVKTIPPYKPISGHDSQSSDSSDRECEASPAPAAKSKGPGRKSSHPIAGPSGKSTPGRTPSLSVTPVDKKKHSPSRRGSSAGDAGSSSKTSTPTPSPQHTPDAQTQSQSQSQPQSNKGSGRSTPNNPAKIPLPLSPRREQPEMGTVISSIASIPIPPSPTTTCTVVQSTPKPVYQESVITNTEAVDTKQTKKRKAIAAAMALDYTPTSEANVQSQPETVPQASTSWEQSHIHDTNVESGEKVIKKAKTDSLEVSAQTNPSHFVCLSPAPPPPPPPQSPAQQPSPRHLPSPMPGPSGINQMSNIRSPSHAQCAREREPPTSLLVSVPLPPANHGLNLAHPQIPPPPPDMGPSPHIFHQPHKQAAMDPGVPHSPHNVGRSAWGGLNVAYEMQDPNKPSTSMDPPVRTKKRAAMATSVVAMTNPPMQTAVQNLSSIRRPPQPTPPPIPPPVPMYQETIKDSPPNSPPGGDRSMKVKMDAKGGSSSAPHMLGNELNPASGAAARLQEQLSAELAAHAAAAPALDTLVPPPLVNKAAPGASAGCRGSSAQSLDQLLERQWEQGSQFLMEQAQHFDIASLLSCLHQLRTENVRLEEHVGNLLQRRDHLLAVNARLAIPLTTGPGEPSRCPRENGGPMRAPSGPVRPNETITSERAHQLIMREVQQKPS